MSDKDITTFKDKFENYIFYDENETYQTDILIYCYYFNHRPYNVQCGQSYTILHCDYGGVEYKTPPVFYSDENYIAVSDVVATNMKQKFDVLCDSIEGLMIQKPQTRRILRLISCCQLHPQKGSHRMERLCKILNEHNIPFIWDNYCKTDVGSTLFKSRDITIKRVLSQANLFDRMADADYLVQLSDAEGYCRAVHESLLVGTPVLVTDIPIFKDVVINGYNGYRLPLDMNEIDIQRITNDIPRDFEYINQYEKTINQWEEKFKGAEICDANLC